MKKANSNFWERKQRGEQPSPKPQFYLTEKEKKDGQSSIIHRWLELADRLFELDNDDSDPTPSAA
jgi:hypothetical protein